jgi:hypothetical protein
MILIALVLCFFVTARLYREYRIHNETKALIDYLNKHPNAHIEAMPSSRPFYWDDILVDE